MTPEQREKLLEIIGNIASDIEAVPLEDLSRVTFKVGVESPPEEASMPMAGVKEFRPGTTVNWDLRVEGLPRQSGA